MGENTCGKLEEDSKDSGREVNEDLRSKCRRGNTGGLKDLGRNCGEGWMEQSRKGCVNYNSDCENVIRNTATFVR